MEDRHNLERFKSAQAHDYEIALEELRAGFKQSHWIWYIFPQLAELGYSPTAKFYGISGIDEARAYLADPQLGAHLAECADALLALESSDPSAVMGYPDDLKLRSSMTLFEAAGAGDARWSAFSQVIGKFYDGKRDSRTLELLRS